METRNQITASSVRDIVDARRHPRFTLEVNIDVHTRTCGTLKGYTVDISESGISAMLSLEVPPGEVVTLEFTLPRCPVMTYAVVRQRNAFRYGFQFLELNDLEGVRSACRQFALEQMLISPDRR